MQPIRLMGIDRASHLPTDLIILTWAKDKCLWGPALPICEMGTSMTTSYSGDSHKAQLLHGCGGGTSQDTPSSLSSSCLPTPILLKRWFCFFLLRKREKPAPGYDFASMSFDLYPSSSLDIGSYSIIRPEFLHRNSSPYGHSPVLPDFQGLPAVQKFILCPSWSSLPSMNDNIDSLSWLLHVAWPSPAHFLLYSRPLGDKKTVPFFHFSTHHSFLKPHPQVLSSSPLWDSSCQSPFVSKPLVSYFTLSLVLFCGGELGP